MALRPQQVVERLEKRQVRFAAGQPLRAASTRHARVARLADRREELVDQRRLAEAGLARHRDQAAGPVTRLLEGAQQLRPSRASRPTMRPGCARRRRQTARRTSRRCRRPRSREATSAVAGRSRGSFCRHSSTSWSSAGGTSRPSRDGGTGASLVMLCSTASGDGAWNGCWPVSSSYSRMPSAKTSLAVVTASPRACSGDRYPIVPSTSPVRVSALMVASPACWRHHDARQAEVEHLDVAVVAHHHVVGLDVTVDDLPRVRDGQRLGDLARQVPGLVDRRALADHLAQRAALHQLHHDEAAGRRPRRSREW